MPTYTESEVRESVVELIKKHGLTWEEFLELGEDDSLLEVSPDLDFAYRAIVPTLAS